MSDDGLIPLPSRNSARDTADRLEAALKAHGITLFARIDHAAGAASAGLELRPTEVLIFGDPRAGTPLMQAAQTMGLDLPLKVLVWEDAEGKTWLTVNDLAWLARRHGLVAEVETTVAALNGALAKLAEAATS